MINLKPIICLSVLIMCFVRISMGQPVPTEAWYDGLDLEPQTEAGYETLNRQIAMAYAPIIVQVESAIDPLDDDENTSDDGLSDRPLAVDFDNDWDPANNWDNLGL